MKIEVNISESANTVTVHIETIPLEDMGPNYVGKQEFVDTHRVIEILSAREIFVGRATQETSINNKRRGTSSGTWVFEAMNVTPVEPTKPVEQDVITPPAAPTIEKPPEGVTARPTSPSTTSPKKGKLPAKRKPRKRVK
tara:strand:- start:510 stop:926 length:417 start_codon:yes stop_codon:yes gene_type:complete